MNDSMERTTFWLDINKLYFFTGTYSISCRLSVSFLLPYENVLENDQTNSAHKSERITMCNIYTYVDFTH